MKRVAIIGGGMAGLSAAHYLYRSGKAVDFRVFEESDRLGGKVVTDRTNGFTIEGGPDSFITQKPWGLALCKELGLEDQLIPCNEAAQKVYILVDGKLIPLPAGFRLTVPTRIWPFLTSPLFSWPAKLRMALEPFVPARRDDEDESVTAFITRRLGREAADKIGGPLMAGIYVADPERLSICSTFPLFRQMEAQHGSLRKAMKAAARQPGATQPMFMSLTGGMGQLIDHLIEPWTDRCHTQITIESLRRQETSFYVNDEAYDAVILATPLAEASRLLSQIDPTAASALASIRYVSTATISLGYRLPLTGSQQALDGFGFVIPASERRSILACTWSSTKFPGRAPAEHALLRVFIGGIGHEHRVEQDDHTLVALARHELKELMGLTDVPVISRIYRWPRGNPQYDVGHLSRMDAVERQVADIPGLYLAGSGYRGIGLPDCIRSGQTAANNILQEIE
jgi:oxygen-dependent protoporphyrinogen oxidase